MHWVWHHCPGVVGHLTLIVSFVLYDEMIDALKKKERKEEVRWFHYEGWDLSILAFHSNSIIGIFLTVKVYGKKITFSCVFWERDGPWQVLSAYLYLENPCFASS